MAEGPRRGWAIGRYAATWAVGAALGASAVIALVSDDPAPRPVAPAAEPLAVVAQRAGCVLREGPSATRSARPPTAGRAGRPVASGVYERPLPTARLLGSLRRGAVVLQYRPGLGTAQVTILERLGREVPGAIVAPDASGMPHVVAATAWQRLLGCRRFDARGLVAVRSFARRFAREGGSPGP